MYTESHKQRLNGEKRSRNRFCSFRVTVGCTGCTRLYRLYRLVKKMPELIGTILWNPFRHARKLISQYIMKPFSSCQETDFVRSGSCSRKRESWEFELENISNESSRDADNEYHNNGTTKWENCLEKKESCECFKLFTYEKWGIRGKSFLQYPSQEDRMIGEKNREDDLSSRNSRFLFSVGK